MSSLLTGAAKRRAVREMFDTIAPRYDLINRIMTLRLDVRWRQRTVRELGLPVGSVVADVACGTGDLCTQLARRGYVPMGFDLSMGMLRARRGDSCPAVNADALELPVRDRAFDGAVCGFALRNLTEIGPFLSELARTVARGGRIALLEVDTPSSPPLRWGHGVYFRRVAPLVGSVLSDSAAYRYLPDSVAYLPSFQQLSGALRDAGFSEVHHLRLTAGVAQLITATRDG